MSTKSYAYRDEGKKAIDGARITVFLYERQRIMIDKIVEHGTFCHSRSELVRKIIDMYLVDYNKAMRSMELLTPEQIKIMGE